MDNCPFCGNPNAGKYRPYCDTCQRPDGIFTDKDGNKHIFAHKIKTSNPTGQTDFYAAALNLGPPVRIDLQGTQTGRITGIEPNVWEVDQCGSRLDPKRLKVGDRISITAPLWPDEVADLETRDPNYFQQEPVKVDWSRHTGLGIPPDPAEWYKLKKYGADDAPNGDK